MKKPDNILRLKYRLELKKDGTVRLQILKQDKALTNPKSESIHIRPSILHGNFNGWEIRSVSFPSINIGSDIIYLRGCNKSRDKRVVKFYRPDLIPSIHKALWEMVKHVYGNCTVVKE